jgi:hypothetical protein
MAKDLAMSDDELNRRISRLERDIYRPWGSPIKEAPADLHDLRSERARRRQRAREQHETEMAELGAKKDALIKQQETDKLRIRGIRERGAHEI